jgi:hypothetical protein
MTIEQTRTASFILLIVFCAASTWAQDGVASEPRTIADTSPSRVIRDPHTSMCWLLERNPARRSGPGRMVLLGEQEALDLESARIAKKVAEMKKEKASPVIRSGDRVVVEENSVAVEARLEAVALASAIEGAEFRVRLAIGGHILRVVAIAPGRAVVTANAGRP